MGHLRKQIIAVLVK